MISGHEFFTGPWQDVNWLLSQVDQFYAEKVTGAGLGTPWSVTMKKIVEQRKWSPSLTLYDDHFESILEELGILYVPKQVLPGPGVLFPLRDYRDRLTHGKLHPFYDLELRDGRAKYGFLGKAPVSGPNFFGQTDAALRTIARTRQVVLVEGYYDLLACRLLSPNTAVLSTGTKSINDSHIQFLRLLGVQRVQLMFDHELPKPGKDMGEGERAMRFIQRTYRTPDLDFVVNLMVKDDASMCLESRAAAVSLKNVLQRFS